MKRVLSVQGDPPKRTLEEILAYSRETGMDWALTADEAGLLRREVERLRARHHEASTNPSEDPTEAQRIEDIRLWLERDPGPYQHEVDDARDVAAWLLAVLDGRAAALTSERERAATEEREAVVRHLRERAKWFDEMGRSPAGLLSDARVSEEFNEEASHIERGEHRK